MDRPVEPLILTDEGGALHGDERGVPACAPLARSHGTPERTPSWTAS